MIVRRVVTGQADGGSLVVQDGPAPRSHDFKDMPGMSAALVWATPAKPVISATGNDPVSGSTGYLPEPGGTRLVFVTFPPDAWASRPDFDPAAAGREYAEHVPDLAARMEPDHPGMHTTESIDYGVVLDGELWLELDGGREVHLKPHDVIVQNGTRHAWRNKGDTPAKVVFVLIGADRA